MYSKSYFGFQNGVRSVGIPKRRYTWRNTEYCTFSRPFTSGVRLVRIESGSHPGRLHGLRGPGVRGPHGTHLPSGRRGRSRVPSTSATWTATAHSETPIGFWNGVSSVNIPASAHTWCTTNEFTFLSAFAKGVCPVTTPKSGHTYASTAKSQSAAGFGAGVYGVVLQKGPCDRGLGGRGDQGRGGSSSPTRGSSPCPCRGMWWRRRRRRRKSDRHHPPSPPSSMPGPPFHPPPTPRLRRGRNPRRRRRRPPRTRRNTASSETPRLILNGVSSVPMCPAPGGRGRGRTRRTTNSSILRSAFRKGVYGVPSASSSRLTQKCTAKSERDANFENDVCLVLFPKSGHTY